MRINIVLFVFVFLAAFAGAAENKVIGTQAPEWENTEWINSKPLKLSQLAGKVVFLRFFMESSCPFCSASAPVLNRLYDRYADRGLVVIGMYTPKPSPRHTELKVVQKYVKDYGFRFPVALDNDWRTLNAFWLSRVENADYTSVSFLVDRRGIIRYVHPGGAYSAQDAETIETKIRELLNEP